MIRQKRNLLKASISVACSVVLLWSWGASTSWAADAKPKQSKGSSSFHNSIYRHWFASPYKYMFDDETPNLTIGARSYGRFMAGIGGIVRYGGMTDAAAKHLKIRNRGFYDLSVIEKLAGHKIYKHKSNTSETFSHFNPKIIRWGHKNLIPTPTDRLFKHTYQRIYKVVFSRFFRLMADSYLYLKHKRSFKKEARAYLKAMTKSARGRRKEGTLDGIAYLQKRYAGELPAYHVDQDGTVFTPQMAIGFWIRRSIDRTHKELYTGMNRVMTLYDGSWWKSRLKQVATGAKSKRKKTKRRLRKRKH